MFAPPSTPRVSRRGSSYDGPGATVIPDYFPAFLDLRGRRCVVVGGGAVGERKVLALLDAGARVVVVSPGLTAALVGLAAARALMYRRRAFRASDVRGAVLVVAATGVRRVDRSVARAALRSRALVNVVDVPAESTFIFASVVRRGQLQVAVSTGGRSPALARELRRRLDAMLPVDFGEVVDAVGRDRAAALARGARPEARRRSAERLAAKAVLRLASSAGSADERGRRSRGNRARPPHVVVRLPQGGTPTASRRSSASIRRLQGKPGRARG